ncbi:hypothetical protein GJAV_G00254670 [Gymnothorax javanicus]|nr:hypothetical protein GJAV_G00254670 [Gymnothorax javanicus]
MSVLRKTLMFPEMLLQSIIVLWLAQLGASWSGVGPEGTITATLGQPVLLTCNLGRMLNVDESRVYWQARKPTGRDHSEVLHCYNKGVEEPKQQSQGYRGRTSIDRDGIANGNLSLLINEAKVEDDNIQIIVYLQENAVQPVCQYLLRVAAKLQTPVVNVTCKENAIELDCASHGSFPLPELTWTGLNHQANSPPSTVTVDPNDGTYSVRSILQEKLATNQTLTCYVTNSMTRETVNASVTPSASCKDPKEEPPKKNNTPVIAGVVVLLVFSILIVILIVIHLHKNGRLVCSRSNGNTRERPADPAEETSLQEVKHDSGGT